MNYIHKSSKDTWSNLPKHGQNVRIIHKGETVRAIYHGSKDGAPGTWEIPSKLTVVTVKHGDLWS